MKVDLATVVLGWDKALGSTDHVLSKGAEFAKDNGIAESDMLDWRLAPDMFPLGRQVQIVCNLVYNWAARAADVTIPDEPKGETVESLKEDIAATRRFLAGLGPEQFDGRDSIVVTVDLGVISPTMPIGQWVLGFAQANILFHLSIAYAILRSRGVPLGKADLFGGGL
jgi:hypothetical protein